MHSHTVSQFVIAPVTPHRHHVRTEKDCRSSQSISVSLIVKPIIDNWPIKNSKRTHPELLTCKTCFTNFITDI